MTPGPSLEQSDRAFNRSMVAACRGDDLEALEQLLSDHPDALFADTPYGTWLHVAADAGARRVVGYFLSRGLDPDARGGFSGGNALNEAAFSGHLDIAMALLEAGSTMDTTDPARNPLFGAILGGHMEVVRLLVERGIDKSVAYTGSSMSGMTAEAFARERGQLDIAEFLRGPARDA